MGTIDMSQVAGFKAVDAEGNELGVVSMSELTASISEQVLQTIAMRNQANTLEQPVLMSSASTLAAANDAFENELQQVSDANWVRALLADGTPVLWNKSDLASVVGGLLPKYSIDDEEGLCKIGTTPLTWTASTPSSYGAVKFAELSQNGAATFIISSYYATTSGIEPVALIVIVNNRGSKVSVRVKNITGGKSHSMDNQGCSIAYKYNDSILYMYVPAISDHTKVTCLAITGSVSLLNIMEDIPSDATKVPYDGNV